LQTFSVTELQSLNRLSPAAYQHISTNLHENAKHAQEQGLIIRAKIKRNRMVVREDERERKTFKANPNIVLDLVRWFLNCQYVQEMTNRLAANMRLELEKQQGPGPVFIKNFLIAQLLMLTGGHRGDALRNMTLGEWQNMQAIEVEIKDNDGKVCKGKCLVVSVKEHKTWRQGEAYLSIMEDSQMRAMLQGYADRVRPLVLRQRQLQEDPLGAASGMAPRLHKNLLCRFFLLANGGQVERMEPVTKLIKEILVKYCGYTIEQLHRNFTASNIRVCLSNFASNHGEANVRELAGLAFNHSLRVHNTSCLTKGHVHSAWLAATWQKELLVAGGSADS
jgi:hypothetical protein